VGIPGVLLATAAAWLPGKVNGWLLFSSDMQKKQVFSQPRTEELATSDYTWASGIPPVGYCGTFAEISVCSICWEMQPRLLSARCMQRRVGQVRAIASQQADLTGTCKLLEACTSSCSVMGPMCLPNSLPADHSWQFQPADVIVIVHGEAQTVVSQQRTPLKHARGYDSQRHPAAPSRMSPLACCV
jgi:hypothetical protein